MKDAQREIDQKWNRIESNTLYPNPIKPFDWPIREFTGVKRQVQKDSIGKSGSFQCTKLNKEVSYESEEEEKLYKILELATKVVWYQEQPAEIKYSWGGRQYFHYPDVAALTDDGHVRIIEAKDCKGLIEPQTVKKAFVAIDHFHPQGIGYNLITGDGETLRDLAKVTIRDEVQEEMLELLYYIKKMGGDLNYGDYKLQKEDIGFNTAEELSFCINHDLAIDQKHGYKIVCLPDGLTFKRLLNSLVL